MDSLKQGVGGLFLGFIMDGARSGVSGALELQGKIENKQTITPEEAIKVMEEIKKQTETKAKDLLNGLFGKKKTP